MEVQPQQQQRFFHMPKLQNFQKTQIYTNYRNNAQQNQQNQNIEFDGKRLRKAVTRKTVDYNSSINKYLENRIWQRDYRDRRAIQPDAGYNMDMVPPIGMLENPINSVTTKFVRTSTNKMRCPIFCVSWTPEGRRLITGASSGEFTLWNGLTFNFETILQAHDAPVRCMVWSHSDTWMVTGDHAGYIKYWQSNMNNVKMFQGHKEPLRGISFCPTDSKFASCSDDGTVRIWDFYRGQEENVLRGHGADVKCVAWHPQKALLVSGSKDSQQPVKLWDPRTGQSLATIHAHKSTVMEAKWNRNGNWLLTASRDHLLKLFDIRNMSTEVQVFRGHKREACSLAWHPIHETLFASGGSDGCIMFWIVGTEKEVGGMEQAHDSCVWSISWHPLGHILCSGSNDHSSKFWTRNRPGDRMRDKYNLNTMPKGIDENAEFDELSLGATPTIPGMGLEDQEMEKDKGLDGEAPIPGLDYGAEEKEVPIEKPTVQKKVPFSKPIPRQFQQKWQESKQPLLLAPPIREPNYYDVHNPDPHHYFAQGVRIRAPPPNKYVLIRNPQNQDPAAPNKSPQQFPMQQQPQQFSQSQQQQQPQFSQQQQNFNQQQPFPQQQPPNQQNYPSSQQQQQPFPQSQQQQQQPFPQSQQQQQPPHPNPQQQQPHFPQQQQQYPPQQQPRFPQQHRFQPPDQGPPSNHPPMPLGPSNSLDQRSSMNGDMGKQYGPPPSYGPPHHHQGPPGGGNFGPGPSNNFRPPHPSNGMAPQRSGPPPNWSRPPYSGPPHF